MRYTLKRCRSSKGLLKLQVIIFDACWLGAKEPSGDLASVQHSVRTAMSDISAPDVILE